MIRGLLIFLVFISSSFAEFEENPLQENTIINSDILHSFYEQLNELQINKEEKVSIVHIGDSHIQADFFPGRVRKSFQKRFGNAGRGFVFPYQIAKSGGALDVRFKHQGIWQHCNIMRNAEMCNIGAAGFTVTASPSSLLVLDAVTKAETDAAFNKITFLDSYGSFLPTSTFGHFQPSKINNRTVIKFDEYQDSLEFKPLFEGNVMPELQGMVLENSRPGVLYHAMGVNGSSTVQYLKSSGFEKQINELNASLIIISFGTNDAYVPSGNFSAQRIKERYRTLIARIRSENPTTPILITTPPDHYYLRKYSNKNVPKLVDALYELADEEGVALWDFYNIMGGANSIVTWRKNGNARGDLIHLTQEGYFRQGDLLFNALMSHYIAR
jgi:lysophospholipase L1-like esterase